MYKKKADLMGPETLSWVIILVFVVLFITFFDQSREGFARTLGKDTCRLTAATNAYSGIGGNSDLSENCPITYVTFFNKYVTKQGEKTFVRFVDVRGKLITRTGFDYLTKDIVFRTIADEMTYCWDKFGKGAPIFNLKYIGKAKNCGRCAVFSFNEEVQPFDLSGFLQFLKDNHPKQVDKNYYDYMHLNLVTTADNINLMLGEGDYDPNSFMLTDNFLMNINNNYLVLNFLYQTDNLRQILSLSSVVEKQLEKIGFNEKYLGQIFFIDVGGIDTNLCESLLI